MSALSAIKSVAGAAFRQYGESATYTDGEGNETEVRTILFDPDVRQDLTGAALSTNDPYVLVHTDDVPNPYRGDQIVIGERRFAVRDIEQHATRNFHKLMLEDQESNG